MCLICSLPFTPPHISPPAEQMPGEGDCRDLCLFILAPCRTGQARPFGGGHRFSACEGPCCFHRGRLEVRDPPSCQWPLMRMRCPPPSPTPHHSTHTQTQTHTPKRAPRDPTAIWRRDAGLRRLLGDGTRGPLSDRPVQLEEVTDSCHRGACLNFSASQYLNVTFHERPASTLFKQLCLRQH